MDNVPNNGNLIQQHMYHLAAAAAARDEGGGDSEEMLLFLKQKVVFLNTMVDRITSQRSGDAMVPQCEPIPAKALLILDPHGDLPNEFVALPSKYGVVIRYSAVELEADISLKLRVANGTHTALAHTMALLKLSQTNALSTCEHGKLLIKYVDALVQHDIVPGSAKHFGAAETKATYEDWRRRLIHPHFGLSTFFITQNGPAKGGIRLGPTVVDLVKSGQPIGVSIGFAFASLLRWLTPAFSISASTEEEQAAGVYTGWLQGTSRHAIVRDASAATVVEYADGLRYDLEKGWYEFRRACFVQDDDDNNNTAKERILSDWLAELTASTTCRQPPAYVPAIRAYLLSEEGGNLQSIRNLPELNVLANGIATLYARMVAGDGILELLQEFENTGLSRPIDVLVDNPLWDKSHQKPLHYGPHAIPDSSCLLSQPLDKETVRQVVASEVKSALVIDLHTHLLPPSHGTLCQWGIDELLTYVSNFQGAMQGAFSFLFSDSRMVSSSSCSTIWQPNIS
jgi:hypothetical protein